MVVLTQFANPYSKRLRDLSERGSLRIAVSIFDFAQERGGNASAPGQFSHGNAQPFADFPYLLSE